ncbi:hypothetical protein ACG33_00775 [Steroidobacter denitrificans]|uniref:Uncharacterized protein n=1 Tax=Steroidobacter denitrificans TaxID=465721 RepID=A0A127F7R0_STEDE|nr:hypothetical protein [Steroidobacter denitrificans]AMN45661.1 hypothetical protein ACG33_00775 [Steroidobacter denitrificans]
MTHLAWLMIMGSLSGLISVLAHAAAGSALGMLRERTTDNAALEPSLQTPQVLLHMFCGMGLGLIFWLSWGFAAVVHVAWWVRGLSFGGLCWTVLTLPCLINAALVLPISCKDWIAVASRWFGTCLISALACAWGWERIF